MANGTGSFLSDGIYREASKDDDNGADVDAGGERWRLERCRLR